MNIYNRVIDTLESRSGAGKAQAGFKELLEKFDKENALPKGPDPEPADYEEGLEIVGKMWAEIDRRAQAAKDKRAG